MKAKAGESMPLRILFLFSHYFFFFFFFRNGDTAEGESGVHTM